MSFWPTPHLLLSLSVSLSPCLAPFYLLLLSFPFSVLDFWQFGITIQSFWLCLSSLLVCSICLSCGVCLPLPISVFLSPCLSLFVFISLDLNLNVSASISISPCLCPCMSLSVSAILYMSIMKVCLFLVFCLRS